MLYFPGIDYFFSDTRRALFFDVVENFVDILSRNFQNHIYPIQKWSRDFALVTLNLHQRTGAWLLGVLVISAFAGVHRTDEHKVRRIVDGACDPGNHYGLVFQWLTEHFQYLPWELSYLVKK